MGASASRRRDDAWTQLQVAIPPRMEQALGVLVVVSEAPATQCLGPRAAGTHATSTIPAGVRDVGAPPAGPDRSLFDFHSRRWNNATSFFEQRLATYQAELAVERLRHPPERLGGAELEAQVIRHHVDVDALEVAVRFDLSLRFVRWLRAQCGRDPDFGWILSR